MSGGETKLERRDWMMAGVFLTVALILRIPFRSHLAYHWDGAQFALAIEHYDMRISQPQPPGYFLYVMLGRLVKLFVGEPHTSLIWISVFAGAALTGIGFLLATAMFGRGVGVATAMILATSPVCWFHSEVALTSIVDAALVTATVLVCWTAMQRGGRWRDVLWMSVLFAAVAGVRQQSGAILAPLWCYTLLRFRHPRRSKMLGAAVLTGLFIALWLVPMVRTTGGIAQYLGVLRAKGRFDAPRTPWGSGGIQALLTNVSVIGRVCWVGLLLAALISTGELVHWVFRERPEAKRRLYSEYAEQIRVLTLWIAPMLAFWLAMYVTTPGYVLCFFPGLTIVAGVAIRRCAGRLNRSSYGRSVTAGQWSGAVTAWLTLGFVVGANTVVFVWEPRLSVPLLADLPLTAVEIQRHDRQLTECFRVIREKFRPEDVVIYHSDQFFYWGFRQFQCYLTEYRNVLLTPDASLAGGLRRKQWVGEQRQTIFADATYDLPCEWRLLVVPPGQSIHIFGRYFDVSTAKLVRTSRPKLYLVRDQVESTVQKLNNPP